MLDNFFRAFTQLRHLIMTTQYSILSVLIRPEIQEKITIGFLLINGNEVFFDYSKHKLGVAKNLLSANAYNSLKDAIHNINATANNYKHNTTSDTPSKINSFSVTYIEYLSRYNNNILSFTALKSIEVSANLEVFTKLFHKFIDNTIAPVKKTFVSEIQKFKKEKKVELSKHFNIDKKITPNEIEGLIVPVSVTLIGQNEVPAFVQTLDLERSTSYLIKDISEILFLQKAFVSTHLQSVAMAITNEPNKNKYPEQHDIWEQLRNTKDILHYDISDADAVIEYAVEHNVHPFIK